MSDIFDEIIKDHEYHRALLQRVVETHGNSMERQNVFQELKLDITAHADAEEQTFYAALLSKPDVQDQARHSIAEHKEADDLIEKLAEMDFSSPGWIAAAEELQHKMVHHMDEEEEDVFKLARQVLSENEINHLGTKFRQRKQQELASAA